MKKDAEAVARKVSIERVRDLSIIAIIWIVIAGIILLLLGKFIDIIIVLALALFLSYIINPVVVFLKRYIPGFLAIPIAYILVAGILSLLFYLIITRVTNEVRSLISFLRGFNIERLSLPSPLHQILGSTNVQIRNIQGYLIQQVQGVSHDILPFLDRVVNVITDLIVVIVLSIYMIIDGPKAVKWLTGVSDRFLQKRTGYFIISTTDVVMKGYIRGQVFLSFIIGFLITLGMFALHVPFALVLGIISFFFEFIPILGTLFSGALCIFFGLTHGVLTALFVLIYVIIVHVLEGYILGPKIVGGILGLHPAISLLAVIVFARFFGIAGALFAAPIAGIIQVFISTVWKELEGRNLKLPAI